LNYAYLYIEISVVLVVDILLVGGNDGTNVLLEGLLCLSEHSIISKKD